VARGLEVIAVSTLADAIRAALGAGSTGRGEPVPAMLG
jgi:hypothetical protein